MNYSLLDRLRCSCGSEELRVDGAVTIRIPPTDPAEAGRCQKFCGLKQTKVAAEAARSRECMECQTRVIVEGVLACGCGQSWQIRDRIPQFSVRHVTHDSSGQLRVVETNPTTDPRWETFVARHAEGSIYHHPGWIRAIDAEYRREGVCLACDDSDGQLLAILPMSYTRGLPFDVAGQVTRRRLASLPRTPSGGPLSIDPRATQAVVRAAVDRARQQAGVQIQIKTEWPDLEGMAEGLVRTEWRPSYVLDLPDDPAKLTFGNSVRRHRIKWAVNKATKLGLAVRAAENENELRAWYDLYLDAMRRNAVPPRPYRFFQALWSNLHQAGLMQLLLAERAAGGHTEMVAGSIFLLEGKRAIYAFTGCRKQDLALHPNDLIQWNAIQWACRNGFRQYDFGEVPEEHQQLANFKGKWGAEPRPLYRYYWPGAAAAAPADQPAAWSLHQFRKAVWRRLPLSVTSWLGDWIYSYL